MLVRAVPTSKLCSGRPATELNSRRLRATPTLLVDNYDSYTYNLYQLISRTHGVEPVVILNDAYTVEEIQELVEERAIRSVIISPGPGGPVAPHDIGVCRELVLVFRELPILGVCLGHQILASVYGGDVRRVAPVHGRLSSVCHSDHPLFRGIPSSSALQVVRYHSLAVEESTLPPSVAPIAWTCGGSHSLKCEREEARPERVLMGLAHVTLPHYGVQFHPESIGSTYGVQLLKNFQNLTETFAQRVGRQAPPPPAVTSHSERRSRPPCAPSLQLAWRKLEGVGHFRHDALFNHLFRDERFGDTCWLDSAAPGGCRFSFMAGPGGPLWQRLVYRLTSPTGGTLHICRRDGTEQSCTGSIWDFLNAELEQSRIPPELALPFDFCGGFVGYWGYELKALCGGHLSHQSQTPDASLFFVDRFVAIDALKRDIYCVALYSEGVEERRETEQWLDVTSAKIAHFLKLPVQGCSCCMAQTSGVEFQLDRDRRRYEDDIQQCMERLYSGDSYEICLTNKFRAKREGTDDWLLYRRLRRQNPAPYGAWLKFALPDDQTLTVCSSSPERFLKGGCGRTLEAKPIKGTAPRSLDPDKDRALARELQESEKNQAENLMIVDLLRNDLGRVSEPSSVHVPFLMEVLSLGGGLERDVAALGGVVCNGASVAFPGGSMTGAPKVRTMEILDGLEGAARGVYSGSIGYLSVNDTFDLNIAIRTAVVTENEIVVGAGGAIVLQSDPAQEFEEMQLKASAVVAAIP